MDGAQRDFVQKEAPNQYVAMALALVFERSRGAESRFAPYIAALPAVEDPPRNLFYWTEQQLALAWQSAPAEPSVPAWVSLAGARPPPQAVGSPSGHRAAQRSSVVLGAGRREHGVRRWVGWGEALPAAGAWWGLGALPRGLRWPTRAD